MQSRVSSVPTHGVTISPASFRSYAELVNKTERSQTDLAKRAKKARKKLLQAGREMVRQARAQKYYAVAVTLTFAEQRCFDAKLISRFVDCLRKKLMRMTGTQLMYAWVLERAATFHYHLIVWLPRSVLLTASDLHSWWPWGSTWVESCQTPTGWLRYMTKSATKVALPKGARIFGLGGLDAKGKLAVFKAGLPRWLLALLPEGMKPSRVAGGWANSETGELYRSPYRWTPRGMLFLGKGEDCSSKEGGV